MTLRLATRRSPLALVQAHFVQRRLEAIGVSSELVLVETRGDLEADVELAAIAGQGVFTVEIQRVLLRGSADVAVHSAKDLPATTPEGLVLACVPERRDAADALVGRSLSGLGPGARVATGSPRRRALLLERRPDLDVVGLRGNMATRLSTPGTKGVDAVVAAVAALERLDAEGLIAERLDPSWFVPQVGQGALGLEARLDDAATLDALASINDEGARATVLCERAFLEELGAGCAVPAGAHAEFLDGSLEVSGVMIAPEGTRSVRASLRGREARQLGRDLARVLRDDRGGGALVGAGG